MQVVQFYLNRRNPVSLYLVHLAIRGFAAIISQPRHRERLRHDNGHRS
jgi:hypothetical protein